MGKSQVPNCSVDQADYAIQRPYEAESGLDIYYSTVIN